VPGKGNPPGAVTLDLELILTSHLLVRIARSRACSRFGAGALDLLPKKDVIQVHCESPDLPMCGRYAANL